MLDSATDVPPVGALPDRVTVAVEAVPPVREVGLSVKLLNVGVAAA